jgi:hypothetical protein
MLLDPELGWLFAQAVVRQLVVFPSCQKKLVVFSN